MDDTSHTGGLARSGPSHRWYADTAGHRYTYIDAKPPGDAHSHHAQFDPWAPATPRRAASHRAVSWGGEHIVHHPSDERLNKTAGLTYDPWAHQRSLASDPSPRVAQISEPRSSSVSRDTPSVPHTTRLTQWPAPRTAAGGGHLKQGPQTLAGAHDMRQPLATLPPSDGTAKAAQLQKVLALAERLGLLGPMPDQTLASEGETMVAASLRRGMLQRARETYDVGRLETSLKWFSDFQADVQRLPPFQPLQHAGDIQAMTYNQQTLDMFTEYLRRSGSRLKGRNRATIKSDTIATYVGQIKKLRTHEAHYTVVDAKVVNVVAPAALKRMRQLDGPPGQRQLKLGIRARHLRAIAESGFDRRSYRGSLEWGAAVTAHNLLLRGGEIGVVDGQKGATAFDSARDMTIGCIEFKEPCEESSGLPWLTIEIVPIKDTTARRRSAVMPVQRRGPGTLGSDPLDPYDAVVIAIWARLGRMPPSKGSVGGPDGLLPLFVGARGKPWTTGDTRKLAQRFATTLQLDPQNFGGKSFRIGGATDYRAVYGPEAAERMVRQRGRWWSDIHELYQRALASEHLQGSAAVGDATGAELEALCKGWAQPASFR